MAHIGAEDKGQDIVSVDDAATEFDVSRRTIFRWIKHGALAKYGRGGDKRTYVSRTQLRKLVGFREIPVEYDAETPGART